MIAVVGKHFSIPLSPRKRIRNYLSNSEPAGYRPSEIAQNYNAIILSRYFDISNAPPFKAPFHLASL